MNNLYKVFAFIGVLIIAIFIRKKVKANELVSDRIKANEKGEQIYWLVGDIKFKSIYKARAYRNELCNYRGNMKITPIKVKNFEDFKIKEGEQDD